MNTHLKSVLSLILATALLVSCEKQTSNSNNNTNKSDSLAFGDIKYKSHALEGNMYLIPSSSNAIPEFDTMKVVNTLYADSINIPERDWKTGFPGLPDRFEWFGIEYTSKFKAVKSGRYRFRLNSDDGSKLYIDDSLLINNDGIHGVQSLTGELDLDTSVHRVKLQYIQGPRWYIALQLFGAPANEKEQIFPGSYFKLVELNTNFWETSRAIPTNVWWLILFVIVAIFIFYTIARRKKQKPVI